MSLREMTDLIIELGHEFYDTLPDYTDMVGEEDENYDPADGIEPFVSNETEWFSVVLRGHLERVAEDWKEQRDKTKEELSGSNS